MAKPLTGSQKNHKIHRKVGKKNIVGKNCTNVENVTKPLSKAVTSLKITETLQK